MNVAEQKAAELNEAYRQTFASESGKRVLADLAIYTRIDAPRFVTGGESWQPAFRDGAASVLHYIRTAIATQPNTINTPTIKK